MMKKKTTGKPLKLNKAGIKQLKGWAIFGACAVVVLLAIHYLMVAPVDEERAELEAGLAQKTQLIKSYRKKVEQIPEIEKELNAKQTELDQLLKKYPKGIQSATLEQQLSRKFLSLQKSGLKTTSFLPLSAKKRQGFTEVYYKFNFKADINGLAVFLENLGGFAVPVSVRDIEIQVTRDELQYPLGVSVVLEAMLRE